ncbi:hypothetical protein Zmor_011581 [Zophobas morio]|uniref:Uncharacterized protein n=1 Tax=Zophobas morio TaxID=2755281 RepID=A0AA38MKW8_9CUCU|nr:hypothetical protein Zmor_011581 [Zophobas morio]
MWANSPTSSECGYDHSSVIEKFPLGLRPFYHLPVQRVVRLHQIPTLNHRHQLSRLRGSCQKQGRYPTQQRVNRMSVSHPTSWDDVVEEALLLLFMVEERPRPRPLKGKLPSTDKKRHNRNQKHTAELKKF